MKTVLDFPFITVDAADLISVRDIFSGRRFGGLTGPAWKKIVSLKFLLAIAQAACRPETDADLPKTSEELAERVRNYLDAHEDCFLLDDPERPFLQHPAARIAKAFPIQAAMPGKFTGNNAVIQQSTLARAPSEADCVMAVLTNAVMPFAGKKHDAVWIGPAQAEKKKPGPSPMLGMTSCIHVFILGKTLLDTIRLNMLPASDLRGLPQYSAGLGTPPWERMPEAETGADAEALRHSLMGRLIPMARFQLLEGGMLHSTAGIEAVPISEHGAADPSVVVYPNKSSKKGFVACGLSFMSVWETAAGALTWLSSRGVPGEKKYPPPLQAAAALERAIAAENGLAGLWAGGIDVRYSTGEQVLTLGGSCRETAVLFSNESERRTAVRRSVLLLECSRRFSAAVYRASERLSASDGIRENLRAEANVFIDRMLPEWTSASDPEAVWLRIASGLETLWLRRFGGRVANAPARPELLAFAPGLKNLIKELKHAS